MAAIRVYEVAVFRCFGWPFSIVLPGRFHVFRAVKKQDDDARAWYWDGFRWYSRDCDVAFLEDYLAELDWDQYLYIRVGEDLSDIDYHGGLWDNPFGMCLTRGIEFDED